MEESIVADSKNIPLDESSVDLVVTSPPYNVGVEYDEHDDSLDLDEYAVLLQQTFEELDRVCKEHARVCVNVGLSNVDGITDVPRIIKREASSRRWEQRLEIIWDKGECESASSWGSWRSSSSPRPIFRHEYIFVYDVGNGDREYKKNMKKEEFMQLVKSVWNVKPDTSSDHPAAFPEEIPRRLIKLNSYEEDVVLDPFAGSGTTGVACQDLNREYIGLDISKEYCLSSQERMKGILVEDGLLDY